MGLLGLTGCLFRCPVLSSIHADYMPMALGADIALVSLGLVLLVSVRSRAKHPVLRPTLRIFCAGIVILSLGGLAGRWFDLQRIAIEFAEHSGLCRTGRISLLTCLTLSLAASGMLLLSLPTQQAISTGRRNAASILAGMAIAIAATVCLGYAYDVPLMYGDSGALMAIAMAVGLMAAGLGLLLACGPESIVLRPFTGPSCRARLLRAFLPLTVGAVLVQELAHIYVLSYLDLNKALLDMLVVILFAGLAGGVACSLARSIGGALDKANADARNAQNAFCESEHRFRTLFDHAAIGIAVVGADGRIMLANPAIQRMLGYTMQELQTLTVGQITHPEDRETDYTLAAELLAGKRETYRLEKRYVAKDGRVVWANLTASVLRWAGVPTALGMIEDITDRKRSEEALRRSEENLHKAQRMEAVGLLAGGVAHDFRNQLTIIKGFAEMLLRRSMVTGRAATHIEQILRAAERSSQLTAELLAFSSRQELHPEVLDLNQTVTELATSLKSIVGEDVRLSILTSPAPTLAVVDPGRLQQAIINLVLNARDALSRGGTITIDVMQPGQDDARPPAPEQDLPPRYAVVTVSDDGDGMDQATRERLFEPFFTTKGRGKGTGLGLATVYGFVKQSGGYIDVESEPGRGTTFRLYLPRASRRSLRKAQEGSAPQVSCSTGTILLVEDEDDVRDLVSQILEEHGYRVLAVATGKEAVQLSQSHQGCIDLLVTDVVMPGMNGSELADQLHRQRPDLPVLYLSGHPGDVLAQRGVDPDRTNLLMKPFRSDALLGAILKVRGMAPAKGQGGDR